MSRSVACFGAKATLVAFEGVSWSRTMEVVTRTENSSRHLLVKHGTKRWGRGRVIIGDSKRRPHVDV